jgi:sirohydrochlorin cobaltochelatase
MQSRSWVHPRLPAALFIACALILAATAAFAHGDDRPQKTGVLIAAFGVTMPEAKAAYENIEKRIRAEFPDLPLYWAYTSKRVRRILEESGASHDSPAQALAGMMDADFTHVAVLSLHVIPGKEYHGLAETAHAFSGMPKGMRKVLVTYPLLGDPQDMEAAAKALLSIAPAERAPNEALVFMGHGSRHPGNAFYPAMQYYLSKHDKLAFVGAVDGAPSLDDVLAELKAAGTRKAYLLPLMTVAGDHAVNDMAGEQEDSWKSALESRGVETVPVLRGLGEYDAVVDIWVEHLQNALGRFGN